MIYLAGQLWLFLVLTAGFAAFAGWAWAEQRAAPGERALRAERDNLFGDLMRMGAGEDRGDSVGAERETDALRRLLEIRDGRIAELEHALEAARGRANDAASRVAELERIGGSVNGAELARLRALSAARRSEHVLEAEVEEPAEDEQGKLQAWRLRYFEQRVIYLEARARDPASGSSSADWRAREAEARANYLEQELRTLMATASRAQETPFAANADVDALLRWRMLYLERRVAYLQEHAAPVLAPAPPPAMENESERWKWRARYLEARLRHLEQGAPSAIKAALPEEFAPFTPTALRSDAVKPPVLPAARNGGPDDFTLIDEVTAMQQSTLYALGVFHFDQIADWTPANVAWVDHYLRLGGRIVEEEWIGQAEALAREGVGAARRMLEDEGAV